ncbi:mitogen-activated protein kinase kinase kinase 1, partial [Biomphalaria pfeifferi]
MKNRNVFVLTHPQESDDRRFIVKENVFTDDRKVHYYVNNELLQSLKHENLISYYGYIVESNLILTFFDYMPAGSLQDLYNQQGQIQESKCFNYAEQILEGLQYLHSRRIAHMNIR